MDFPAEQEFSLIYIAYASGVISDVVFLMKNMYQQCFYSMYFIRICRANTRMLY